MSIAIDITGQRFGRLVAIKPTGERRFRKVVWECLCDCGNKALLRAGTLSSGNTKSCGCLATESKRRFGADRNTYKRYMEMRNRCENPKNRAWSGYGGRGVTVCARWGESFQNFFEDMGECPKGKSIDRIDNDQGYSKANCRWATSTEQNRNKRNTLRLEFNGVSRPIKEWAEITGISYWCLVDRLYRGWPDEKTLSTPSLARAA